MRFLLRNLLPFFYFQTTRLNSVRLAVYHLFLEWIPATLLALYFNPQEPKALITLLLSYAAFISIYEIGYIVNDYFSERFEREPRGRLTEKGVTPWAIITLILFRAAVFVGLTFVLGVEASALWGAFYFGLVLTFAFHNFWSNDHRLSSFFGLSVFRFLGPLVIVVPLSGLMMLLPAVMLYYSLFRAIAYGAAKGLIAIGSRESFQFKLIHYLNIVPLSVLFAVIFSSPMPIYFCGYYLLFWGFSYFVIGERTLISRTGN